MKTKAALLSFLFAWLAVAFAAAGAETRLIPFDDFYISVPVTEAPNSLGLQVFVKVLRGVDEPHGGTGIEVSCQALHEPDRSLEPDEVVAFSEACAACMSGQDYRKEFRHGSNTRVYEAVTAGRRRCVRIQRGGEALFGPEEAAKLKAALAQAKAAEAWYKKLLTAGTLPEKTAAAHPPKASAYYLNSKLGGVRAEGVDYVVSLRHYSYNKAQSYQVMHGLQFIRLGGEQSSESGAWVKRLLEQVALALQAVGRKEAFAYVSPQGGRDNKFTVTANLETQQADVTFDPSSYMGKHSPVQGSFGVKQLAEIREIAAQGPAREKWFAEHEGWFFEKR